MLDQLRCPTCRTSSLRLETFDPPGDGGGAIVRQGALLCDACRVWYPIDQYVPVLLDFETPFHGHFATRHAGDFGRLSGFTPPRGQARPGEQSVQETFTDQWDTVQADELSFGYTDADLAKLNREVWLTWLPRAERRIKRVLNVGAGLGAEARMLRSVTGADEVVGVDLNFAILQSGPRLQDQPEIQPVVASLFALPFPPGTFDLVYSQGVIHHTFSTRRAFDAIARHVASGGYLFVWVYGLDDHLVPSGVYGLFKRLLLLGETVIRPVLARSPGSARDAFFAAATLVAHPVNKAQMWNKRQWKLRNTNHNMRDKFSPRFAHRHSYNQLLEWFEDLGFDVVALQSPAAYRRLFKRQLWGVGATGRKS